MQIFMPYPLVMVQVVHSKPTETGVSWWSLPTGADTATGNESSQMTKENMKQQTGEMEELCEQENYMPLVDLSDLSHNDVVITEEPAKICVPKCKPGGQLQLERDEKAQGKNTWPLIVKKRRPKGSSVTLYEQEKQHHEMKPYMMERRRRMVKRHRVLLPHSARKRMQWQGSYGWKRRTPLITTRRKRTRKKHNLNSLCNTACTILLTCL